jgi:hypothetical protein
VNLHQLLDGTQDRSSCSRHSRRDRTRPSWSCSSGQSSRSRSGISRRRCGRWSTRRSRVEPASSSSSSSSDQLGLAPRPCISLATAFLTSRTLKAVPECLRGYLLDNGSLLDGNSSDTASSTLVILDALRRAKALLDERAGTRADA